MKMFLVLAFMALIASVASTQTSTCSCGQRQDHEKIPPQQHQQQVHGQQQQQQQVHVQQQPQQKHHEQPQQHHHQQYQGHVQQQPPQDQHGQQSYEHPQQQQTQCHKQQPCRQGNEKQQTTMCGYNYCCGRQNLNNCHEFLRQQCNPLAMPFLQSRLLPPSSCQVLRQQCCQELRQIEPQYLHQAIYGIVQSIIQHQQEEVKQQQPYGFYGPQQASQSEMAILMAAQYLPSMCGMYHSYGQNSPCDKKDSSGVHN